MPVKYEQLDQAALDLLIQRLPFHKGSRAALARELGVSRSGLSQAMDGKYPGHTSKLRARIFELLADGILCPHLGSKITPTECRGWRERPLSAASANPAGVRHWQACQSCLQNPMRQKGDAA